MAQSKPPLNIQYSDGWVSLNTLASIPVGTKFTIQNRSNTWGLLEEGAEPAVDSDGDKLITNLSHFESSKVIPTGSLEIWAKSTLEGRKIVLSVQEG